MSIIKRYKTIIYKFLENAVAYGLPVIVQQFFVYPIIAKKLGAEYNGQFLAMIALDFMIINITAAVLVNTRMLQNEEYKEKGFVGDYNFLLLLFTLIDIVVVVIGTIFYSKNEASLTDIILSIILIILLIYQNYITVQYRLELKFNKILINNVILCAGYFFGIANMYFFLPKWQVVFITPYTMTAIFDMYNTDYIKEPLKTTPLFRKTVHQYILLMLATLLQTAVTYGDRLLLYPFLGGTQTSIFTSAQLIGKMMQMLSTPITTFVLAYLVKQRDLSLKINLKHILIIAIIFFGLYTVSVLISRPLIFFLYPEWANESIKYVGVTAFNGIVLMICVVLNVFVLRFCDRKWQLVRSGIYLFAYMIFSFGMMSIAGLWGFCFGNATSSIVQLIVLLFIALKHRIIVFKAKG